MKGVCEIQLINEDGTIAQSTRDENMVTNAVRNLLNPPPAFWANEGDYVQHINACTPVATTLMGGVLLWGNTLAEDPNNILHLVPEDFVGHAGDNAYSGDNQRRGSYNPTESGVVDGGYRHVWDFSTNQANGTIRCVSLTSAWGGRAGLFGTKDETSVIKPICTSQQQSASFDIVYTTNLIKSARDFMVSPIADDGSFYVVSINQNSIVFEEWNIPIMNVKSAQGAKAVMVDTTTVTLSEEQKAYIRNDYTNYDKKIIYDNGVVSFYNCRYEGNKYYLTKWVYNTSNKTLTNVLYQNTPTAQGYKWENITPFGDHVYATTPNQNYVYRLNLANATHENIFEINKYPYIYNTGYGLAFKSNLINSVSYTTKNTPVLLPDGTIIDGNFDWNASGIYQMNMQLGVIKSYQPFMSMGMMASSSRDCSLRPAIYSPYCATIDNLSSAVTKTASQTMKIIYTIMDIDNV